jgi:hypothetical protein
MTPEEIARGLTKAQRDAVLNMQKMYGTQEYFRGSPATLHALKRKGLSDGPFADMPTPSGLAVRDILKGQDNG